MRINIEAIPPDGTSDKDHSTGLTEAAHMELITMLSKLGYDDIDVIGIDE